MWCLHRKYTWVTPCVRSYLPHHQRDERVLVVWSYNLDSIIPTCRDFEDKLIKLVWKRRSAFASLASSIAPSTAPSDVNLNEKSDTALVTEKAAVIPTPKVLPTPPKKRSCGLGYWKADASDLEKTAEGPSSRPMRMFAPVYCGLGAALSLCKSSLHVNTEGLSLIGPSITFSLCRKRCKRTARRVASRRKLVPFCPLRYHSLPVLCLAGTYTFVDVLGVLHVLIAGLSISFSP